MDIHNPYYGKNSTEIKKAVHNYRTRQAQRKCAEIHVFGQKGLSLSVSKRGTLPGSMHPRHKQI